MAGDEETYTLEGQLRDVTLERNKLEMERRETDRDFTKTRNRHLEYLEKQVGYTYSGVNDLMEDIKKNVGRAECSCFQVGVHFSQELQQQRDELLDAIRRYGCEVHKLLDAKRKAIREGDVYGIKGEECKPILVDGGG